MRVLACLLALGLASLVSTDAHADYFAYGNLCSTCTTLGDHNRFYDDGLHNDGAAGDGLLGATVISDVAAGSYGWMATSSISDIFSWGSTLPACPCSPVNLQSTVWTQGPGDVIQLRIDTRDNGWVPNPSIASNRGRPTTAPLMMRAGFFGEDIFYYPNFSEFSALTTQVGTVWEATVFFPSPTGRHYGFVATDNSIIFTLAYSTYCGCFSGEQPMAVFTTTEPNTFVQFQFDEFTGRMRAEPVVATPTQRTSWGKIRAMYR